MMMSYLGKRVSEADMVRASIEGKESA